tara:strand:+ start:150 stop:551 length:402 start_codon:yes stop_codon:yes gene_type:complete
MKAIYDDVKITINLNELVEIRAKLLSQYEDYSNAVVNGEYLDGGDIDKIATQLRDTLTWDTLYHMIDGAILDYMGLRSAVTEHKTHYGERTIETIELTMEKERKEREKEFKKNFDLVELDGGSWKLQVPVRKK